jgi:mono/diheme cytochrome c family protein
MPYALGSSRAVRRRFDVHPRKAGLRHGGRAYLVPCARFLVRAWFGVPGAESDEPERRTPNQVLGTDQVRGTMNKARAVSAKGGFVAVVLLLAAAATVLALPWSQDMVRGRAVAPQTQMHVPPANTLAIGHPRILDRIDAEDQLTNPLAASPEVVEQGRSLFGIYCAVCHGADGRSAGPVGKHFPMVADLSTAQIQEYPDGALYSIIREGGFKMPGYAETLSMQERWAVVHFVRSLRR